MPKYGNFVYGGAKYGNTPKLTYSVEPMSLIVLDFERTRVTWQLPSGDFTRIRLVRSQYGFPEHPEDGVILWDEFATEGSVSRNSLVDPDEGDGSPIPLLTGSAVYYRVFLFVENVNYWVVAGQITDTVPSDHELQKKLFDVIPKVYTSIDQSPLAVVDTTTDLYQFLESFSFTLEQLLTFLDLLRPGTSSKTTPFEILPAEMLNYGLIPDTTIPVKNRKKLVREAIYLYQHKGLLLGLEAYIETLTGYAPSVTVSPNLLLTVQDSTFYNSIGNWQTSTTTLTATTEQVPLTNDYTIDTTYTGKAVAASGSSFITLGANTPITKGIPVVGETDFTFGYKYKSPTSAGSVRLIVKFYDKDGTDLASDFTGNLNAANNTWQTSWQTTETPADAVYASLKVTFSAAGTYYLDQFYVENGENLDNTSYQEARAINIFLDSNKQNYIKNPSFELNTNQWTITATANSRDTEVLPNINAGDYSLNLDLDTGATIETTTGPLPLLDRYYTLSFYAKASAAVNVEATLTPEDDGTPVDGEVTETFTLDTEWQRFSLTGYIDADLIEVDLTYVVSLVFDTANGEEVWVDSFQLEHSLVPTDYNDGSLPAQFGAVWEGTAHASNSHIYFSKSLKIQRIKQTLDRWIPMNAFWRLLTYDGVEATNLSV